MEVPVVLILVVLWVAILLPSLMRARREASPASSVDRFHGSMDLLERTSRARVDRAEDAGSGAEGGDAGIGDPEEPRPRPERRPAQRGTTSGRPRPRPARAAGRVERRGPRRRPAPRARRTPAQRRRVAAGALLAVLVGAAGSVPFFGALGWALLACATAALAGYLVALRRMVVRQRVARRRAAAAGGAGAAPPPVPPPPPATERPLAAASGEGRRR